jgi:hypothetical protein
MMLLNLFEFSDESLGSIPPCPEAVYQLSSYRIRELYNIQSHLTGHAKVNRRPILSSFRKERAHGDNSKQGEIQYFCCCGIDTVTVRPVAYAHHWMFSHWSFGRESARCLEVKNDDNIICVLDDDGRWRDHLQLVNHNCKSRGPRTLPIGGNAPNDFGSGRSSRGGTHTLESVVKIGLQPP